MELGLGLRWAVESCRSAERGPAAAFAAGALFDPKDLDKFVPSDALTDLCEQDLISITDGKAQFVYLCSNHNNLVSIVPSRQDLDADFVHVNTDTFWLLRVIWEHTRPGDYAVELGTGNGIVAAHLVARFKHVLATDLPGPWLEYAQLTLAANAGRGRPSAAVACDVATALRPRSFDLVAANSPWSPAPPTDTHGNELTFMAGGSTGTELPARFLREGAALLRPGGTAITLCLDPEFEDGSRPLMPVLDGLCHDGYTVECIESEVFPTEIVTKKLRANRLPTLRRARHIAVIVRN
nr:hypothetical protein [uncultured bacterium]